MEHASLSHFEVLSAGLMTTLQDEGRFGYEDRGIPPSGVMDELSFALANALVGNAPEIGVLEFTLTGPKLRLVGDAPCLFAITGDAVVTLNGQTCEIYQSHIMQPGDVLSVTRLRSGARGYLAVAGGFAVAPELGSVSTLLRAGLGGVAGRILQKQDQLPLALSKHSVALQRVDRIFPQMEKRPIRVVWGPQDYYFDNAARAQFLAEHFRLTPQCDRMGYRLKSEGDALSHARGFNIISDTISRGSIQVPGDGQPIIAMNDRQTTGGYPKIATVIRADLARLGQLKPGDVISFEAVSVEKAEYLWRGRQQLLKQKRAELKTFTLPKE